MKRAFDLLPALLIALALSLPAEGLTSLTALCVQSPDLFGVTYDCGVRGWAGDAVALVPAIVAIIAAAIRVFLQLGNRHNIASLVALIAGAVAVASLLEIEESVSFVARSGFWIFVAAVAILAVQALRGLSQNDRDRPWHRVLVAGIFGLCLLFFWQVVVLGFQIAPILLPPPSEAGHELITQAPALWADFRQTFLKAVLAGFAIGSALGFAVAVLTDRVPFLQRGLLPLGNMASAVPIIGIAPIMVMMFGFDWQSKAAVIVVMTFFPMLINTIAGLAASDHMQRDLMRSYGAGYWQTLAKLRLPAALPFVFNALKINSTLALIGGIVAEFFGSPTVGLGFRINTMAGRNDFATVWATIAVAALAGSMFYGLLALLERGLTFWHPSYRARTQNR